MVPTKGDLLQPLRQHVHLRTAAPGLRDGRREAPSRRPRTGRSSALGWPGAGTRRQTRIEHEGDADQPDHQARHIVGHGRPEHPGDADADHGARAASPSGSTRHSRAEDPQRDMSCTIAGSRIAAACNGGTTARAAASPPCRRRQSRPWRVRGAERRMALSRKSGSVNKRDRPFEGEAESKVPGGQPCACMTLAARRGLSSGHDGMRRRSCRRGFVERFANHVRRPCQARIRYKWPRRSEQNGDLHGRPHQPLSRGLCALACATPKASGPRPPARSTGIEPAEEGVRPGRRRLRPLVRRRRLQHLLQRGRPPCRGRPRASSRRSSTTRRSPTPSARSPTPSC